MSLTTAMQTVAALMIITGGALLAFAAPGRLVIIGGVMIVAALQIWHDRRVTRHHGREVRREDRYAAIVRATPPLSRSADQRPTVTCLAGRQQARASRK